MMVVFSTAAACSEEAVDSDCAVAETCCEEFTSMSALCRLR
jgi:hypothetical protein